MFKRNQVEEAIAAVLQGTWGEPNVQLHTRIKRLLETDRSLGRSKRSSDPERANFAFYTENAPGRGVESWFSGYEAFALLTGLLLMRHGWPQRFVVIILRQVRPELERHHARILAQDRSEVFDEQPVRQRNRPGKLDVGTPDPLFFAILSTNRDDRSSSHPAAICRGESEMMRFVLSYGPGYAFTIFPLVKTMHDLASALTKTRPRKRGRGSR
jgi:hypothetical protein